MPFGFGRGHGRGRQRRAGMGKGRGRMAVGPGNCICPRCGSITPHNPGVPCFRVACPNCGSTMTRQFDASGLETPRRDTGASPMPVVSGDACTGCRECLPVCPEQAIEMRDDKAFILAEKCTNCRICIPACPVAAIQ